jgi:hypothetical protein
MGNHSSFSVADESADVVSKERSAEIAG